MTTIRRCVPLIVAATVLAPAPALAQRIEIPTAAAARRLPAGYLERMSRVPEQLRARGGWIARVERSIAAGEPVTGDLSLVAIPALFSDSPEPQFSAEDLRAILFTGPAAEGTLREFYAEVSGGRLNIAGDVGPWVRTSLTMAEVVGSTWGLGGDARIGEYLVEALTLVDPVMDFGLFDNDGPDNLPNSGDDDGYVDAIAFYFLEIAASCGGPAIWPHFWGLSSAAGSAFETDDLRPDNTPVKIDPYFIQSIVSCDGSEISPITTIGHELGHRLGLPDLYHPVDGLLPEERRWVVGCWSLMAAGAWGCGPVDDRTSWRRPTHMGAWEKKQLGWLNAIQVVPASEIEDLTLTPVRTSGEIIEVPLGSAERLLIEYREQAGFDLNIPAEGVLVYRINDTLPMRPCHDCLPVYHVGLVEADGDSTLIKTHPQGGNRGEPGDAWGVLGPGALTNLTEPSTRLDAGLGDESGVNIYRIELADGSARILLSTAPVSLARLLGPLLLDDANLLTEPEEEYLDQLNNKNGRYDVGDLRAYWQRTAGSREP